MKNIKECVQEIWMSIKMFFCRHNEVTLMLGEKRKPIRKKERRRGCENRYLREGDMQEMWETSISA